MPCHPDRVRRHYHQPKLPLVPANRETVKAEAICGICGGGEASHVLSERGHDFIASWIAAFMTANVIEGDHH